MSAQVPSSAANTPLKGYQASPSTQVSLITFALLLIGVIKMFIFSFFHISCITSDLVIIF